MGGVLRIGAVEYPADAVTGEKLVSSSAYLSDSLVADSLGVDSISAVVRDQTTEVCSLAADGLLLAADGQLLEGARQSAPLDERVRYGDELEYLRDGKSMLKIRVESVERIGPDAYQILGISAVGLLLTSYHYGGIYTGQPAAQIIADIVGGIFPYTLDAKLGATPVFGWLPKQPRRDALRDVLFAIGGQVRKDAGGAVVIAGQAGKEPYAIDVDEFYMGGSVTGGNPATGLDLTEHAFTKLPDDGVTTLFDGESAAEQLVSPKGRTLTGVLVDFGEPMHDLTISNAEILESGANYAVISGSPAAVLTGKAYTHTQRIISRRRTTSGVPNIVTSSACTLVNLMNSELVADRLMAFYGAARTVTANLVLSDQKPGDAVSFTDPFGDQREGFIQDMAITMSGIDAASTTIVSGFIPTASGNYYSHLEILTVSGRWTAPEDVKGKGRIVLIAAGDGGAAGEKGEDGGDGTVDSAFLGTSAGYGTPGKGGAPGKGGLPGKILVATIPMKPGDTFDFTIGAGGLGGICGTDTADGEPGGETTFGSWSSANGFRPVRGYTALLSDEIYATEGESGVAGGDAPGTGEEPTSLTYEGQTWTSGARGAADLWEWSSTSALRGYGGLGGGPAVGGDGENGQDAHNEIPATQTMDMYGGAGGAGHSPAKRDASQIPGSGGAGGHGGGGGGGGAPAVEEGDPPELPYWLNPGPGGAGGLGGPGGDGAPGIILIYY